MSVSGNWKVLGLVAEGVAMPNVSEVIPKFIILKREEHLYCHCCLSRGTAKGC